MLPLHAFDVSCYAEHVLSVPFVNETFDVILAFLNFAAMPFPVALLSEL